MEMPFLVAKGFNTNLHTFFYKQLFHKQRQAEIGKIITLMLTNTETKFLLFENYSHFFPKLPFKNNRTYP